MPFEIPDHFHRSYTTNVEMLLRRTGPKLMQYVGMTGYSGEAAQVVKQFGDVAFREKTTRHSDTQFDELIHKQRWLFPTDFVLTIPVDKEDELKMLDSPLSPYAEAGRLAYGKKIDDIIMASFFGSAQTGKNGVTVTAFDAANVVDAGIQEDGTAGADTGLNVGKLRAARKLLLQRHNDLQMDRPYIAVTAQQMDDLLGSTNVTSADFNTVKALVSGEVNTFLGFEFITIEDLPTSVDPYRLVPVWTKSGVHLGTWNGLEGKIDPRPDKDYLTQIFMRFSSAATRTNEDKVVQIECLEP